MKGQGPLKSPLLFFPSVRTFDNYPLSYGAALPPKTTARLIRKRTHRAEMIQKNGSLLIAHLRTPCLYRQVVRPVHPCPRGRWGRGGQVCCPGTRSGASVASSSRRSVCMLLPESWWFTVPDYHYRVRASGHIREKKMEKKQGKFSHGPACRFLSRCLHEKRTTLPGPYVPDRAA